MRHQGGEDPGSREEPLQRPQVSKDQGCQCVRPGEEQGKR